MNDQRKSEPSAFLIFILTMGTLVLLAGIRGCAFEQVAKSCEKSGAWTHTPALNQAQGFRCTPVEKEVQP